MVSEGITYIATALSGAMLLILAAKVVHSLQTSKAPRYTSSIARDTDLPSVTVCIPARNEQHALTECLERVISSTYEKLEIIVLDDVSGDDTSALIKSFASSGVRFVKGSALPEGWLGKNHALQGLLREASGSYILFMDVDTRLSPYAIENMVRYTLEKNAAMLSVLPRREDGWRASVLCSPLRYLWELLLDRPTQPATASNAWLVRRSVVDQQLGGFEPIKSAIQPESVIAQQLSTNGKYQFIVSDSHFGVGYEKKWRSQLVTSVRLLYPLLGNTLFATVVVSLDLLLIVCPWVVSLSALWLGLGTVQIIAGVICLGYMTFYALFARKVWRRGWWIGALLWPLLVIQELVLVIASAVQYKRKAVTWKGRPIQPVVKN